MAITRAEFNQAFREVAAVEFAEVPCETEVIFVFSDKFEQKMQRLIAHQKKSYWTYVNTAKKRVAIAVISLLSILLIVMSNEEVRASMLKWCENVYEQYIHYYFEGETTKKIEHEYQLTVIPEGFEKVYEQRDLEFVIIGYENQSGDYIQLEQYVTEDFDIYVDNENGEWSTTIINNQEVKLCDYTKFMGAMWIEDRYYMHLIFYGCDNIEIIKEMVKSIN